MFLHKKYPVHTNSLLWVSISSYCESLALTRRISSLACGIFFFSFTRIHALLYSTHWDILVGRSTAVNEIGCGVFSSVQFCFLLFSVRSFVRFSFFLIECFCHLFLAFSIYRQLIDISRLTHTNQNKTTIIKCGGKNWTTESKHRKKIRSRVFVCVLSSFLHFYCDLTLARLRHHTCRGTLIELTLSVSRTVRSFVIFCYSFVVFMHPYLYFTIILCYMLFCYFATDVYVLMWMCVLWLIDVTFIL